MDDIERVLARSMGRLNALLDEARNVGRVGGLGDNQNPSLLAVQGVLHLKVQEPNLPVRLIRIPSLPHLSPLRCPA